MPRLHAGVATRDVTPEPGVALSGYGADERTATGVHDPLKASALVLSGGADTVALVAVDLLNVSHALTDRVRGRLATRGVPVDELVLAATHTHAGPYVPAAALDVHPSLEMAADPDAIERIEAGIADAVASAHARLAPATLRTGRAENDAAPANRRALGGVGGGVRAPHGPIDPELRVLDVEAGGERAVVVNFACHPVCTTPDERLVSADWPGYARDAVDAEVLFVNGAAADVNPRDRYAADRSGDGVYEYMAEVGREVAATAEAAIADARAGEGRTDAPVIADRADLRLPVKGTPPVETLEAHLDDLDEEIGALEDDGEETAAGDRRSDRQYVRELLAIARWDATRLPAELPLVEVGDVAVLGLPAEVFVEHGLEFKAATDRDLVVAGYANGYVGYLPPLAELEHGGYEVRTAKVAPEGVAAVREAALDLLP